MRVRLDKIASCTRNVELHRDAVVGEPIPAEAGTVVAVRVLDSKATYNSVEDVHGRMMRVQKGDVVAGVLGSRQALRGYAGRVPDRVAPGDVLHLLNLGGVIGECVSANPDLGPACRVEVLGAVQHFPELGRRVGVPAHIFPGPVRLTDTLPADMPPVVLVAGTCMHAGKTAASCLLIREATQRGLKVAASKVTGVALRSDTLQMMDHGAIEAVTFCDAGFPSTSGVSTAAIAKGCLTSLRDLSPDLVLVELGDGLLGSYGVRDILDDPEIRQLTGTLVVAATDPVAAWGATELLARTGWQPSVITGPATDNDSGVSRIEELCPLAAINARNEPAAFAEQVLSELEGSIRGPAATEQAEQAG
ncbi:MAG: hypothetical protein VX498_12135 [Myxococcota bacterium]|nr:hypothetical protein [Myxococcota bacterium]